MSAIKENLEMFYDTIKSNSHSDCESIILGNILELKINDSCLDIYKYKNLNEIDENYDFDQDYLTTVYF